MFKVKLVLPSDYPQAPPKGAHAIALAAAAGPLAAPCHLARAQLLTVAARAATGYFLTKIYHPNISKTGEICVNTLKKDWQSSLGIGHVLQVVRCLLINPFPESALNEEAGKDFMEDYEEYCKKAKMFTEIHACAKKSAGASGEQGAEVRARDRTARPLPRSLLSAARPRAHRAACGACSQGEPLEKKQKPVDSKAAEKRRIEKKKSLKRL